MTQPTAPAFASPEMPFDAGERAALARRARRLRESLRVPIDHAGLPRSVRPVAPELEAHREQLEAGPAAAVRWRIAMLALVVVAFWLPRGLALDRIVTPDEPLWLARSANFYKALSDEQWGDTYQYVHPGVMTMWMGTIGYLIAARDYPDNVPGQIDQRNNRIAKVLKDLGYVPLDVMASARAMMVIAMTVIMALTFWQATRLLGLWPAVVGFLLIALDPFQTALARVLHVDSLDSCFGFLALIAFLNYLERGRNLSDLLLSGAAAGFAWLTRSQSLFLVPFMGLLLLIDVGRHRWIRRRPRFTDLAAVEKPLLAWGIAGFFVVMAFWPEMWTRPLFALSRVLNGALDSAEQGHERPIFFLGKVYDGNPGPLFYPVSFLWRSNPAMLAGLALALGLIVIRPDRRWVTRSMRRVVFSLLLYSAIFSLMMTIAAKKFDRYLLPIYAPLAIVAGCGWWALIRWANTKRLPAGSWAAVGVFGLALAIPAATIVRSHPYGFDAYDPAMRIFEQPQQALMIGWGEGTDQIAAFLDAHFPASEGYAVAVDSWPSSLTYFSDRVLQPAGYFPEKDGLHNLAVSDLYVRYIAADQRGYIHPEIQAALDGLNPLFEVSLSGIPYAQVYDIRDLPIPDYMYVGTIATSVWDGSVQLVTGNIPGRSQPIQAGTKQTWSVYFRDLPDSSGMPERLGLRLQMLDLDGNQIVRSNGPLTRDASKHGLWVETRTVTIPWGTPAGTYRVVASLYDLDTGAPAFALDYQTGVRAGPAVQLGCVGVRVGVRVSGTGC